MTQIAMAAPTIIFFMPDVLSYVGSIMPKVSNRKVGGIRFVKVGRLNVSFSVSRKMA